MEVHLVTLAEINGGVQEDERALIATHLGDGAAVGVPAGGGMIEVSLHAASRQEALALVRDAIAAAGVEERVTFPRTTGTDFHPAPYDPPPKEVP